MHSLMLNNHIKVVQLFLQEKDGMSSHTFAWISVQDCMYCAQLKPFSYNTLHITGFETIFSPQTGHGYINSQGINKLIKHVTWMHFKLHWIKLLAKCINVHNVCLESVRL